MLIQQMNYWLERSTHIIEGRPWIYNSYSSCQSQLSFFSESSIQIDDLFKEKITELDVNIIFKIINYRYLNCIPVII